MEKFVSRSKALSTGDPMKDPDMGSKVSRVEVTKVSAIVTAAIDAGAEPVFQCELSGKPFKEVHWLATCVLAVKENVSTIIQDEVSWPGCASPVGGRV